MAISGKPQSVSIMPFAVRPLTAADVLQAQEIERDAFPGHFPPTSFRRELENRTAGYLVATLRTKDVPGLAPERMSGESNGDGGRSGKLATTVRTLAGLRPDAEQTADLVTGFLGAWFVADEAHVITIGVRPAYRGRGIGELLLIAAIEQAYARGAAKVTLEVRPSNFVARNLYSKYRFDVSGVRKAYYADNREDALIMSTGPIGHHSYRELFAEARKHHQRRWGRANLPLATSR